MHPILSTERLILRKFTPQDAQDFYNLNNDPEVLKFTGDLPFSSVTEAKVFLKNYDAYEKYGIGRWAVILKSKLEFIGFCGLKYHPDKDIVEIGYRLFKSFWGQGFATEAAKASIQYGFEKLGYKKIVAHVHQKNIVSQRVLEKIGMTKQQDILYDDQPAILYTIDNNNFFKK